LAWRASSPSHLGKCRRKNCPGLPAHPTWASVGGKTAQGFQPIPPGQVSEEKLPCFRATLAASWSTPCFLFLRQMFVCTYLGSLSRSFSVPLQTFLHLLHHLLVIYTIQYIQYNMCKCNTQYNICNTICANVFTIHYAIYANVSTIKCESVDPLADPLCSGGKFWGSSKCVVFPSQMVVEMSKHGVGAMSGHMSSDHMQICTYDWQCKPDVSK
jgi:hypothetical protein